MVKRQFFKLEDADVPGIVFMDRCRGMDGPIEAMRKYRYKVNVDKPDEEFKDWADAVRYLCTYRPRYVERYRASGSFTPVSEHAGR